METEAGIGELKAAGGETWLSDAQYELVIRPAEILGGLPVIRGTIVNPPAEGFEPSLVGEDAVLRLADGREWDCTLADPSGQLTARGQLD